MDVSEFVSKSDNELVELSKQGDNLAFTYLLSKFSKLIMEVAHSFDSFSNLDWEDYYQEGLIEFNNSVNTFDQDRGMSFKNYSMMLVKQAMNRAYNKSIDNKNASMNGYVHIDELTDMESKDTSPEDSMLFKEKYEYILTNLSEFEIKVVREYILGFSREQIATKLDCDIKSIDNAIQRIRNKVK